MGDGSTIEGPGRPAPVERRTSLPAMLRRSAVVEVVALGISAISAAGGHGTYHAAKFCFPWSFILTQFTRQLTPALLLIAVLQFPAYAFALWMVGRSRTRSATWLGLAAAHAAAVIGAYFAADSAFSP